LGELNPKRAGDMIEAYSITFGLPLATVQMFALRFAIPHEGRNEIAIQIGFGLIYAALAFKRLADFASEPQFEAEMYKVVIHETESNRLIQEKQAKNKTILY
jgi:hypothetical protein